MCFVRQNWIWRRRRNSHDNAKLITKSTHNARAKLVTIGWSAGLLTACLSLSLSLSLAHAHGQTNATFHDMAAQNTRVSTQIAPPVPSSRRYAPEQHVHLPEAPLHETANLPMFFAGLVLGPIVATVIQSLLGPAATNLAHRLWTRIKLLKARFPSFPWRPGYYVNIAKGHIAYLRIKRSSFSMLELVFGSSSYRLQVVGFDEDKLEFKCNVYCLPGWQIVGRAILMKRTDNSNLPSLWIKLDHIPKMQVFAFELCD